MHFSLICLILYFVNKNNLTILNSWFYVTLSLQVGTYQFKYIVDGIWMHDIYELKVSDGFGSFNNYIEVLPKSFVADEDTISDEDYYQQNTFEEAKVESSSMKVENKLDTGPGQG